MYFYSCFVCLRIYILLCQHGLPWRSVPFSGIKARFASFSLVIFRFRTHDQSTREFISLLTWLDYGVLPCSTWERNDTSVDLVLPTHQLTNIHLILNTCVCFGPFLLHLSQVARSCSTLCVRCATFLRKPLQNLGSRHARIVFCTFLGNKYSVTISSSFFVLAPPYLARGPTPRILKLTIHKAQNDAEEQCVRSY